MILNMFDEFDDFEYNFYISVAIWLRANTHICSRRQWPLGCRTLRHCLLDPGPWMSCCLGMAQLIGITSREIKVKKRLGQAGASSMNSMVFTTNQPLIFLRVMVSVKCYCFNSSISPKLLHARKSGVGVLFFGCKNH